MQLDMMKGGSLGFPHECHFKKQAKHVVQAAKGVSKEHGKRGRIAGEPLVALNCRDRQASWYINAQRQRATCCGSYPRQRRLAWGGRVNYGWADLPDKYHLRGQKSGTGCGASRSALQTDAAKKPGTCQQRRPQQQLMWCSPLAQCRPRKDAGRRSAPARCLHWRRRGVVELGVVGAHAQNPVPPVVGQEVGVAGPLELQAEVAPDIIG